MNNRFFCIFRGGQDDPRSLKSESRRIYFYGGRGIVQLLFFVFSLAAAGALRGQAPSFDLVNNAGNFEFRGTFTVQNCSTTKFYFDGRLIPTSAFTCQTADTEMVLNNIHMPNFVHQMIARYPTGDVITPIPQLVTLIPSANGRFGGNLRINFGNLNYPRFNSVIEVIFRTPVGKEFGNCTFTNTVEIICSAPPSPGPTPGAYVGPADIIINALDNSDIPGQINLSQSYSYDEVVNGKFLVNLDSNFGPTVGGTNLRITGTAGFKSPFPNFPVGQATSARFLLYGPGDCSGSIKATVPAETPIRLDDYNVVVRTPHASRGCALIELSTSSLGFVLDKKFTFHDELLTSGINTTTAAPELRLADSTDGHLLDIAGGVDSTGSVDSAQPSPDVFKNHDILESGATGADRLAFGVTQSGNAYLYDIPNRSFLKDYNGAIRRLGDDLPPAGGAATNSLSLIRVIPTDRPYALGLPSFICRTTAPGGCTQVQYAAMAAFDPNPDNLTFGDILERRFGQRSLGMAHTTGIINNGAPYNVLQKGAYGFVTVELIQGFIPTADPSNPEHCMFTPADAPLFPLLATHLWLLVVNATRELSTAGSGTNCTGQWVPNPEFMCNKAIADLGDFAPFNESPPEEDFAPVTFALTNKPGLPGLGEIHAANAINSQIYEFTFDFQFPGVITPKPPYQDNGKTNPRFLQSFTSFDPGTGRTPSFFLGLYSTPPYNLTSYAMNPIVPVRPFDTCVPASGPPIPAPGNFLAIEPRFSSGVFARRTKFSYACHGTARPDHPTIPIWNVFDFHEYQAANPTAIVDFTPPISFSPSSIAMTPGQDPLFPGVLYLETVQSSPASKFDQPSHQQNLINYYLNTVADDLSPQNFPGSGGQNSGQRASTLAHLRTLLKNTDKWVVDPALRMQLASLIGSMVAYLP